jgi:hypothetical protein
MSKSTSQTQLWWRWTLSYPGSKNSAMMEMNLELLWIQKFSYDGDEPWVTLDPIGTVRLLVYKICTHLT